MEVRDLVEKCWGMPTIYHFRTFQDRPAFFRWRHAGLKITVGPSGTKLGSPEDGGPGPYDEGWYYVFVGGISRLDYPDVTDGTFPEADARRFLAGLSNKIPATAKPCA